MRCVPDTRAWVAITKSKSFVARAYAEKNARKSGDAFLSRRNNEIDMFVVLPLTYPGGIGANSIFDRDTSILNLSICLCVSHI